MYTFAALTAALFCAVNTGSQAGAWEREQATAWERQQRYEFAERHVGVVVRIVLYAPSEAAANKAAKAAFARIAALEGMMSDYDPDSELMRLCRDSRPGKPVKVSRELFFVLERSLDLSGRTDGAFDVTVGPLVKLWRRARRRKELPAADRLAAARRLVGYHLVRLDPQKRTVELLQEGMKLDLGGIAKGYIADEALAALRKHGVRRALIDAGGDVVAGDPPPGREGWRIAVESIRAAESTPGADGRSPASPRSRASRSCVLLLKRAAVATSGDAYQYVEIDGRRYSHIIDPKTGLGLNRRCRVTVVAPDGVTADSLASAVSVLGPQRGLKLIEATPKAETLIIVAEESGVTSLVSSGWSSFEPTD